MAQFLGVLSVQKKSPEHVQLHGAAFTTLLLVAVGGCHIGPDGGQMGRALEGHANLHEGGIRTAHGPDAAVAPEALGEPLDGIGAIDAFFDVGHVEVLTRAF